ncbi:MAG TPA: gamma-glutamyltransferase [Xanthobacteraceae bacterium]|nr:gamma-glutamyltransferase [Xanthobacteraceae bacterium]
MLRIRRLFLTALLACSWVAQVSGGALAQAETVAPIIAGKARVYPVIARHGMVASQEARASRIGVEILEGGGNAVDSAVAVAFALAVTLPRAGNLGGGGFMLIHLAREHKTVAIDYRETAPAAVTPDLFLDAAGHADPTKSRASGLAVGVPGTIAGLALAHEKYGSGNFSLADLIRPAIRLAHDGVDVDDDLADSLAAARARLARWPASARIFLKADGAPRERGDRLYQDDLARTLEAIAEGGPRAFYEGAIAERIVNSVRQAGGVMTREDLARYRAAERAPVRGTYRGLDIVSMPPPSSGGVHLIELLNILEGFPLRETGAGAAATLHPMIEAMKLAYADRAAYLGDPDFVKVPVSGLVSKDYAKRLRATIDLEHARSAREIAAGAPPGTEGGNTTHFSIVDREGNAVANTYTLNFSYGLGLVAEGTGVLLNNELDDFAVQAGVPNAYGLVGNAANAPAPGKRPLSSMTPTIVLKDAKVLLVTGSPGGSRIITTVLQVLLNVLDHGMNIAEAVQAPRIHHQWLPDVVMAEPGFSPDTLALLKARGHTIKVGATTGSANSIMALPNGGWAGAADPRQRGTLAIGY